MQRVPFSNVNQAHSRLLEYRYGLGQLEYRQEKFEMAAFNFKRALDVRPFPLPAS